MQLLTKKYIRKTSIVAHLLRIWLLELEKVKDLECSLNQWVSLSATILLIIKKREDQKKKSANSRIFQVLEENSLQLTLLVSCNPMQLETSLLILVNISWEEAAHLHQRYSNHPVALNLRGILSSSTTKNMMIPILVLKISQSTLEQDQHLSHSKKSLLTPKTVMKEEKITES